MLNSLDAAIVSWPVGRSKPKTNQAVSTAGVGALGGAFWGMLFGLIFLVPLFGMIVGAAAGALSGKLLVIQTALVQSPQKTCCKGFTETNMQFRCSTA